MPDSLATLGTLIAVPAISAIAMKLAILWMARNRIRQLNMWFLSTFLCLLFLNLAELSLFWYLSTPQQAVIPLTAYYIFLLASIVSMLGFSLDLSGKTNQKINIILLSIIVINTIILLSGYSVAGTKSTGLFVTRVPGTLYPITVITLIFSIVLMLFYLWRTASNSENYENSRRSIVFLIGTAPFILVIIGALISVSLGLPLNAAVLGSLSINIFLIVIVYTEDRERLFNFMSKLPNTHEYDAIQDIKKLSMQTINSTLPLKDAISQIEKIHIDKAMIKTNGNISEAARILGVSRQTISRKTKD